MRPKIFQIKIFLGFILVLLVSSLLFVDCSDSCKFRRFKINDWRIKELSIVSQVSPIGTGLPTQITIPSIGVDASVLHLGVNDIGEMDAPKDPSEVSWYNLGVKPGDIGSAVMAGHYGWKDGLPAVFDSLNALQVGDEIHVKNTEDETITFIVTEVVLFSEHDSTRRVFTSNDNKSHLNLITCGGTYDVFTKSYSDRLVVFADRK